MSGLLSQVGFVDEVTYGTAVAVTRFYEFTKESIEAKYERIDSQGLRTGTKVLRSDRFAVNPKGASGNFEFEVMNKGFGFFLKHMLGAVATTGSGPYTHTGTVGDLTGDFFTCQVGRPQVGSATVTPFTYSGGKVTDWELSNSVDGVLMCNLGLDFAAVTSSGAGPASLQTASYPTSMELLTFTGGVITIGGSAVDVKDISIKCDNGLDTERYYLRTTATTKKEPLEADMRQVEWEITCDFDSLTQYNRVASATASGAVATLSAVWTSPGGQSLTASLAAARFDAGTPTIDGPKLTEVKFSGVGLDSGTGSPVTLAYLTADTTP